MIKIILNCLNSGYAEWEKDNKKYRCLQNVDGEKKLYSLHVADLKHLKIEKPIKKVSLADINKRLEKTEVEILEN